MGIRRKKDEQGSRQLPVRFSPEDAKHLDEMQQHLDQDAATIVRWAVRHFHKVASDHNWQVTSRGEPFDTPPRAPTPDDPPSLKKAKAAVP